MAKRLSASSVPGGLVTMNSEDIKNRKWTDAERHAIRRASKAHAEGLDLPNAEYEDIPQLTSEQLARMVRLREVRRKSQSASVSTPRSSTGSAPKVTAI